MDFAQGEKKPLFIRNVLIMFLKANNLLHRAESMFWLFSAEVQ